MNGYDQYELYKFQIIKILTTVKDTNANSKSNLLSVETHVS